MTVYDRQIAQSLERLANAFERIAKVAEDITTKDSAKIELNESASEGTRKAQ